MSSWFVPYRGKKVASLDINGHRLVILSHDRNSLEDGMSLLGADRVKSIKFDGTAVEQERLLGKIAEEVQGGVVIAPSGIELGDVIKNLTCELPWFH